MAPATISEDARARVEEACRQRSIERAYTLYDVVQRLDRLTQAVETGNRIAAITEAGNRGLLTSWSDRVIVDEFLRHVALGRDKGLKGSVDAEEETKRPKS